MLPLSVRKECLTGLRPYRHFLSLPTVIFYITKSVFINNNYYLIIKYLTSHPTLYYYTITASPLLIFFTSTATSYMTRMYFINNNYYLIIKYLTSHPTLYYYTITASPLLAFIISYLTGILYLSPTAITSTVIFYITKKRFINNNYYLIIKHLTLHLTLYYHPPRPINTVYNKKK